MREETKLALAACCKSTMFVGCQWLADNFGKTISWELEDYFRYETPEADQFDKDAVLDDIGAASNEEIRAALEEIGFAASPIVIDGMPDNWQLDGDKWLAFVERASVRRGQAGEP